MGDWTLHLALDLPYDQFLQKAPASRNPVSQVVILVIWDVVVVWFLPKQAEEVCDLGTDRGVDEIIDRSRSTTNMINHCSQICTF